MRFSPLPLGLDSKSALGIAAIARGKNFSAGELLFSEGDEADAIYILADGAVDLIKYSKDGRETLIRSVKSGEMFAEAAVFSGGAYPATKETAISIEGKIL